MQTTHQEQRREGFLAELPPAFRITNAHAVGQRLLISPRTVTRWIDSAITEGRVQRPRHGHYEKTQPVTRTKKTVSQVQVRTDLTKDQVRYEAHFSYEPLGPEEIMQGLKIDGTQWTLVQYWNKQKAKGWHVSALVAPRRLTPVDQLTEALQNYRPQLPKLTRKLLNEDLGQPATGVLSIQDLHFGKLGNGEVRQLFVNAAADLFARGYKSHWIQDLVLVLGGDLLNADTFAGTTTSGTLVENEGTPMQAYEEAFAKYADVIHLAQRFCTHLHVVYIPGNHDRLSSFHLAHGLKHYFAQHDAVTFYTEYEERKALLLGNNVFFFEHGEVSLKKSPLTFAVEFAKLWAQAEYRTIYTGHLHKKKTIEYTLEDETNGLDVKIMPSLCSTDYYHKHNKWTGNQKRAILDIHAHEGGLLASLVHIPKR